MAACAAGSRADVCGKDEQRWWWRKGRIEEGMRERRSVRKKERDGGREGERESKR